MQKFIHLFDKNHKEIFNTELFFARKNKFSHVDEK